MAPRTLQPEDLIAHYRIVGPLGAGGMGEVYLAQDQTLERSVALKILPPELVRSEERVRRFQREAKSASSLNHPNIVTIYEIGQDEVRGHEGTGPKGSGPSSAVHYISMELVSGETLTTKIHQDKTDLRTLLGYLAQAAEGLAKAHAAGWHQRGRGRGHGRLHVPRAGAGELRRSPIRHLLIRLDPLRGDDAEEAVHRRIRCRDDAQNHPRQAGAHRGAEQGGPGRAAPTHPPLPRQEPRSAAPIREGSRDRAARDRRRVRITV